ncbi:MAG: exodeoxyribonuclease VII large subunit, partial [Alphaproteobacteria bacterium]|nr:exodeoxyribonuclease VII large subunit [Alphaproteobacteria bacterium]
MADLATRDNLPELSVSDLSQLLKRTVETAFPLVRVRGEISGFKRASSGHCYLTLKDENAALHAVMWKGLAGGLSFRPEDGLDVVAVGKLTTYPGRSRYQLVIERMEPAGIGALLAQIEERRRRLAAEGLFAEERKRGLPFLPEVIGVVTSPTGAVIRDILHRLADRFPRRVLVWPVLVQGEGAAEQVARAIEGFNALPADGPVPRPDVLIVARGGGSIEDLMAFNEERVVRAAAASLIPLISAVGHETDTTLIDHAADRRAPTPTAAAEMAVPVRADLLSRIGEAGSRLEACLARTLDNRRDALAGLARGLPRPSALLALAAQRFDASAERLRGALRAALAAHGQHLAQAGAALRPGLLNRPLTVHADRLASHTLRLDAGLGRAVAQSGQRLGDRGQALAGALRTALVSHGRDLAEAGAALRPALLLRPASAERQRMASLAARLAHGRA